MLRNRGHGWPPTPTTQAKCTGAGPEGPSACRVLPLQPSPRARASWSAVLWAQEEPEEGQAGRDHPGAPGRFVQVRTVSCCDSVCTRARLPTRPSQNDTREAWRATWSEMPVVF